MPTSLLCPVCGREVTCEKKFCRHCGASLSIASPVATTSITGRVFCPGCGNEVTPSKKFCSRCGLHLIPEEIQTPDLRAVVSEGAGVPDIGQPSSAIESVPPHAQASVAAAASPGAAAVRPTAESQSHQQSQTLPENEEIVAEALELEVPSDTMVPRKRAPLPYVIGGLVGSVALAGALGWYFLASPVARLNRAVDAGKLVVPEGSSAYDLYRQFKPDLSAAALSGVREKALPKLNAAGEAFLQRRAEGSSFKESEIRQLVSVYDWAADLAPEDKKVLSRHAYVQGMAASLKGDPSAALGFLQDSVKFDGNWAPAYNELGKAYVRLKDHSHAAESYRKAIEIDPKWVFPRVNLAGVYLHDKQWDLAEQGYLQAIQTDSTYATAWYFLGQTYEAQKRPADSIAAYEKAVQLAATRPSSAFKPDIVQRHVEKLKSKLLPP